MHMTKVYDAMFGLVAWVFPSAGFPAQALHVGVAAPTPLSFLCGAPASALSNNGGRLQNICPGL